MDSMNVALAKRLRFDARKLAVIAKHLREQDKELMQEEKYNRMNKCPKCGSTNIYYRLRSNTYLCRRCGEIFRKN